MKFSLYCLALGITLSYVCARAILDEGEACLVQYLKNKEKLSQDFPSTLLQALPNCDLGVQIAIQVLRKAIVDKIKETLPVELECLTNEFDNRETLDQLVKISIISESKMLSENGKKTQLEICRSQLKLDVEKIAIQCNANVRIFKNIFNEALGIKNETLAVLQYEYCITKYVADNSLLPLNNVDLNPKNINTENVDCNDIIDKERAKTVQEIRDKLVATQNGDSIFECVSNAYNKDRIFDWSLAIKVLHIVDLPKETDEYEKERIVKKLVNFAGSTFSCALANL